MTKHRFHRMTFLGYWDGKERWRGTGFNTERGGLTMVPEGSQRWYRYVEYKHSQGWPLALMRSEDSIAEDRVMVISHD